MRSWPDELRVLGSRPAVLGDQGQISAVLSHSVHRLFHGGAKGTGTRASEAIQRTRVVTRTSPPHSCAGFSAGVCMGIIRYGFSSWTVTEARVCSQSKRSSHVLPFRAKEIVKFSSVDGSFDVVAGTRTMSEAS